MTPAYKPWAESIDTLGLLKQNIALPYQKEEWFYKYKDGKLFPYYKEDIKKKINVYKPCTFFPVLQALDVPFYEEEWLRMIKRQLERGSGDLSSIFGRYLAKMYLHDFRNFGFSDSSKFFSDWYDYHEFEYIPKIAFEVKY